MQPIPTLESRQWALGVGCQRLDCLWSNAEVCKCVHATLPGFYDGVANHESLDDNII